MNIDTLKGAELTATEAKIYLALLSLGPSTVSRIATHANLYRKNTSDALQTLGNKGLTSHVSQAGKRHWKATHPNNLMTPLTDRITKLETILPNLIETYQTNKSDTNVEVLEGIEGMKALNALMLRETKLILGIGVSAQLFKKFRYSIAQYTELAQTKDIRAKFLLAPDYDEEGANELQATGRVSLRTLPKGQLNATQFYIFGEYLAISIWAAHPISVVIQNDEISKGFTQYFNLLWNISENIPVEKC